MFASEHQPGAGHEATVRGSAGENEDLATGQQPFLAGVLVSPYDAVTEEVAQVVGCDVLVPVVLQGDEINGAGGSAKCEFLREAGRAPRQEGHAAVVATLEEETQFHR
jgi:hypothetical protein